MDNAEFNKYKKQISELRDSKCRIKNEKKCLDFLSKVNFYRILPYVTALTSSCDDYIEFKRVQRVYDFDSRMRPLIYEAIQDTELFLRTKFAYYHSSKYGSLGYLESKNFSEKHDSGKFKARIKNVVEVNANNPIIKRFDDKENLPITVVVEFFSMNMLSTFYADMITENRKKLAGELYHATSNQVVSWLCCLTDLRNICAHYSRLYCRQFTSLPIIPKEINFTANRRLFTQLLSLSFLYPDREKWNNYFVTTIKTLLDEYENDIVLNHIGFPQKWENMLRKN